MPRRRRALTAALAVLGTTALVAAPAGSAGPSSSGKTRSLADALPAFVDMLGHEATVFVDALATADRYGLSLAPVLDRLADDIRAERRRRAEAQARTLPVKLAFPLVMCTLPSFVLLAIVPALLGAVSTLRGSAP